VVRGWRGFIGWYRPENGEDLRGSEPESPLAKIAERGRVPHGNMGGWLRLFAWPRTQERLVDGFLVGGSVSGGPGPGSPGPGDGPPGHGGHPRRAYRLRTRACGQGSGGTDPHVG